jgi:hypothetical protein
LRPGNRQSSPNSAPREIQERYQWTKVFGHRLTQLPKLLNRDKTLSNVVLLQHREIRDLRQFGSSARQVHHLSQQSQISIYGCVRRSFGLPLLDELVEQVGRDGRDQATFQEKDPDVLAKNANADDTLDRAASAGPAKAGLMTLETSAYEAWKSRDQEYRVNSRVVGNSEVIPKPGYGKLGTDAIYKFEPHI